MSETPSSTKPEAADRDPAQRLGKAIWLEQFRQEQQDANPDVKPKDMSPEQRKALAADRQAQWKEHRKPYVLLARRVLRQLDRDGFTLVKKPS